MGMFDTLVTNGDPRFTCAHGHVVDDFQTKSLGCNLDRYRLIDDVLHVEQLTYNDAGERLHEDFDRRSFTNTINVYTSCRECKPIASKQPHGIVQHELWVSLDLEIYRGELKSITRAEDDRTRDQLREHLKETAQLWGYEVLADEEAK